MSRTKYIGFPKDYRTDCMSSTTYMSTELLYISENTQWWAITLPGTDPVYFWKEHITGKLITKNIGGSLRFLAGICWKLVIDTLTPTQVNDFIANYAVEQQEVGKQAFKEQVRELLL